MISIARRVAAGARFLDEREPGWWERIDLYLLDMRSQCGCVLGQLATDLNLWSSVVMRFGLRRPGMHIFDPKAPTDCALGFNARGAPGPAQDREYAALEAEWKRVITARRAGAS